MDKVLFQQIEAALQHASQSEHHPHCGLLKQKSNHCDCHVQKCKDALGALRKAPAAQAS